MDGHGDSWSGAESSHATRVCYGVWLAMRKVLNKSDRLGGNARPPPLRIVLMCIPPAHPSPHLYNASVVPLNHHISRFRCVRPHSAATQVEQKEAAKPLDLKTALTIVLRNSLYSEGLCRGLHESVKALDRGQAHLCVLSQACNEEAYKKVVIALCKARNIPLIMVEDGRAIGDMVALSRYRPDGRLAKVIGCTCAVVREWGVESEARSWILNYVANQSK